MAKKKTGQGRRGQLKGAGRITTRLSIVATPEYLDWLAEFTAHLSKVEMSDVVRDMIREGAEKRGFRLPPVR
jgi:hypothetical protein